MRSFPPVILFLSLLSFSFLFFACKQEEEIPPAPEVFSWNAHPQFILQYQRAYNLIPTEQELLVYGERSCSSIDRQNAVNHCLSAPRVDFKFPASEKIRIHGQEFSPLIEVDPWCCEAASGRIGVDLSEDSLFERVVYSQYFLGRANTIGFDGETTFLIPAQSKDHPLFYLLKANLQSIALEKDTLISVLLEEELLAHMSLVNIEYLNGYFWTSFINGGIGASEVRTYRISPDGSYQKIAEIGFNELFIYQDQLYGTRQRSIFVSDLDGNSWEELFTFEDAIVSQLSYQEIDGELFFYGSDWIGKLQLDPGASASLVYLDNNGLKGNIIHSIASFEGRIYAATSSGIYWAWKEEIPLAE